MLSENPSDAFLSFLRSSLERYGIEKIFSKSNQFFNATTKLPPGLIMLSIDGDFEVLIDNIALYSGMDALDALYMFGLAARVFDVECGGKHLNRIIKY